MMRGRWQRRLRNLIARGRGEMIVPEQDAPSAACRLRRQRNLLLLRASVVSVSLGLVLLLFLNLSLWLSPPSPQPHDFYGKTSPECFEPPKIPGDRRRDKEHLKIANFNAEWLFLYGGRGGMRCPAESCPWSVRPPRWGWPKLCRTLSMLLIT